MKDSRLFNCCANDAAPDWSRFRALKVGGCINDPDESGHILGGQPDETAEFWTVYAELKDGIGECEAITDCDSRFCADAAAFDLSTLSGLPVS